MKVKHGFGESWSAVQTAERLRNPNRVTLGDQLRHNASIELACYARVSSVRVAPHRE